MTIEKWMGNFIAQYGGCRNKYPSFQVKQQVRVLKLKDAQLENKKPTLSPKNYGLFFFLL